MKLTAIIHNTDCVAGMEAMADESVHLTVTSIPFEELFTYSGKLEDVGNNGSTIDIRQGRFACNLRYVIYQLFRVTAAGCNVCIHIQQLLAYKNQHGFSGRRDFRGAVIDLFREGGFHFVGEAAIPKDPQAMAQRLSLHSLQFKTGHSRTSTNWAPAPNDYVLIFQRPGEPTVPVRPLIYTPTHKPRKREQWHEEHGDDSGYVEYLRDWGRKYAARNAETGWLSADDWIRDASGTWSIDEFDILDGSRMGREPEDEKHVCPLQLETIRRCISLYSNPISLQPDVTVLDPFMGIGSAAWIAVGGPTSGKWSLHEPRNVIGFELKESYAAVARKNVAKAIKGATVKEAETATLFSPAGRPARGEAVVA